jgi:predicted Zn finger-like uncharacterized protein
MYTRCPECETMFHLSVEDLRQAGGRVRCGECTHVFYGMDFLAEEPDGDSRHVAADPAEPSDASDAEPDELAAFDIDSTDADEALEAAPSVDEILYTSDDDELAADEPEEQSAEDFAEGLNEAPDESTENLGASDEEAEPEPELTEITANQEYAEIEPDTSFEDDNDAVELDESDADAEPDIGAPEDYQAALSDEDEDDEDEDEDNDAEAILFSSAVEDLPALDELADDSSGTETEWFADDDSADDDGALVETSDANDDDEDDEWDSSDDLTATDERDDDESDDEDSEFDIDDTIWEKIPGVGTLDGDGEAINLPDMQQDDTGAFLTSMLDDLEADATTEEQLADSDPERLQTEHPDPESEEQDDDTLDSGADDSVTHLESDAAPELEFNVPEEQWSNVFESTSEHELKEETILVVSPDDIEPDAAADDQSPPWEFDKYKNVDLSGQSSKLMFWLSCIVVLGLLLAGQIVHYNRDSLAASPQYGEKIRQVYSWLDLPLYPRWSIEDYEIRGSEAVVGETGADVMDIRTQIAAIGEHEVGLPLLRVILRDRWSNPVAQRMFSPIEYALAEDLPQNQLLQPNSNLAARLSIIDPGSGAQGYELELCIPHRHRKLQCSGQAFK